MSHILPFCFFIASFTLIAAAAIEEDGIDSSANAREVSGTPHSVKNPHVVDNLKSVGSWKDIVPDLSGWIEVDPATGKPLVAPIPQMTNLKAKPQRALDGSSS